MNFGRVFRVVIWFGVVELLRRVYWLIYEYIMGIYEKTRDMLGEWQRVYVLPPGDMGWPFIGNTWSFLRALKSSNPDGFIDSLVNRYGATGLYKAFIFGSPSIIVTQPNTCWKVLTNNEAFMPGWPTSTVKLIGEKSFVDVPFEEDKQLRRLTAPVNGNEALSIYMRYIEHLVVSTLDKWSKKGKIEFLTELRKLTFRIVMHIFLSSESEPIMEALEREYTKLNDGVRAMAINLPGFAYYNALEARKKLVAIFQSIVDERKSRRSVNKKKSEKKDIMDALLDVENKGGKKLTGEEIIDILLMYLNAGHESSGHIIMWATVFLQKHPSIFGRAKAEQEAIANRRPPTQKGMILKEYRQMDYLSKVIDETLRLITFSLTVFREAKRDVDIGGYTIPKGWKFLVWFKSVHMNPLIYREPKEFNPSRWDKFTPKTESFLPFGAGSRLCPGNDLAKLEISVFLHHFLLNYELVQANPGSPIMYLPYLRPKDKCLGKIRRVTKEVKGGSNIIKFYWAKFKSISKFGLF